MIVGFRFGTRVRVEGNGSGAWVRFVSTGSGKGLRSVGTGSGTWVEFVGTMAGAWERLEDTGAGAWIKSEGAKIGTRLEFGSGVGRLEEPVIGTKVLPTSGVGTEVGLLGTLTVSKVLGRSRVLRVWVAVAWSEVLAVGVEGPDTEVVLGLGVVSGPSVLITWMEGSVVSTTLGLGSVLGLPVLTIGVHGARSRCCFMGDVVATGRATSEPGEGRG